MVQLGVIEEYEQPAHSSQNKILDTKNSEVVPSLISEILLERRNLSKKMMAYFVD